MYFPKEEIVNKIKADYPPGTRVELVKLDDPYRNIPVGTQGTVRGVDDTGTIRVAWDNGPCLGVVYGEDECKKV